ncbi:MAG: putative membrane protein YhhN [Paraglaciecola sp.]
MIKLTVLVIYVLFMLLLLLPVTGTLQVPLLIYLLLMSAMAYSAMVVNTANYHILLGAALFVLSDSLLATHKF